MATNHGPNMGKTDGGQHYRNEEKPANTGQRRSNPEFEISVKVHLF